MGRHDKVSIPILFTVMAVLSGCEKPEVARRDEPLPAPPPPAAAPPRARIPVDRVLQDASGRSVNTTIVGRTIDKLYIVRSPDGMRAEIPISRLSDQDQEFAHHLPIEPPPRDFFRREAATKEKKPEPDKSPLETYVKSREKEIERLEEDNLLLGQEAAVTSNGILKRTNTSKMEKNQEEIVRLRAEIQRAQSNAR